MDDSRWQKIREIFDSASELSSAERAGFIEKACGGDDHLRLDVETLLSASDETDGFMDIPAIGRVADLVEPADPVLKTGDVLGRYEILGKIGEGGMGEVYLAKDNDLAREVAIKLLHKKYADSESDIRRFTQEAKAVSALNHPNILTIHEIGRTENSHYIVSEYIEGMTLREIIRNEHPDISKILDISLQAASALVAAHSAGIIHRDIKPENVIVRSDGYVKVLDFGLAKLLPEHVPFVGPEDATVRERLTAKGLIFGTVGYMSPEQARGDEVDTRTDIFSLGVVIYEMIAGRAPFEGDSLSDTFANLINREPTPLSDLVSEVPVELERICSRALRKDRNERYQHIEELVADLIQLKDQAAIRPKPEPNSQHRSEVKTRILDVTAAADGRPGRRVMLRRLGLFVAGPVILSLIGIAVYKAFVGQPGTIRPDTALTSAAGYARSAGYDQYIRGRVNAGSENRENNEKAISDLEQAVALDPELAPAFAELARAYNVKAFYLSSASESDKYYENAMVAVEKSLALDPNLPEGHFARGLVLWSHRNRFPHQQTIRSYKRAIALNPNLDEAHHQLGLVYFHVGLLEKARAEIRQAIAINPGNILARYRIGVIDMYEGKYEEALSIFESTPLEKNPSLWAFQTATAEFDLGRRAEAEALIDKFLRDYPDDEGGVGNSVKAMLLASNGKEKEAENAIQRAIQLGSGFGHFHHTAFNIAAAYALMHKTEAAVQWLTRAADDGLPCYPLFDTDPSLRSIRNDPGFRSLMAKLKQQSDRVDADE